MSESAYHVFTTGGDWFFDVDEMDKAYFIYNELVKENKEARLYFEEVDENGMTIYEQCIESHGPYPV